MRALGCAILGIGILLVGEVAFGEETTRAFLQQSQSNPTEFARTFSRMEPADREKTFAEARAQVEGAATAQVAALANSSSPERQIDTPSISTTSTSLTNRTGASDLIGLAFNPRVLTAATSDGDTDADSGAITINAMTILAMFNGGAKAPGFYCTPYARIARSTNFIVGGDVLHDDPEDQDDPMVFGIKIAPFTPFAVGRDVCNIEKEVRSRINAVVRGLAQPGGTVAARPFERLLAVDQVRNRPRMEAIDARLESLDAQEVLMRSDINAMTKTDRPNRAKVAAKEVELQQMTIDRAQVVQERDNILAAQVEQLGEMQRFATRYSPTLAADVARVLSADIKEQQQKLDFSVNFLTKQRNDGDDEYTAELAFDKGLREDLELVLNGSFEQKSPQTGDDEFGGKVAGSLDYRPVFSDSFKGPKPKSFSLGFSSKWITGEGPQYKGQFKVTFSVPKLESMQFIEFPISVTVANRTELIDETEVRGIFGFTVDTSKLIDLLAS